MLVSTTVPAVSTEKESHITIDDIHAQNNYYFVLAINKDDNHDTNQGECFHFYQSDHAFHGPQGRALCGAFSEQLQMSLGVDNPLA